jgi:hypothetical protein
MIRITFPFVVNQPYYFFSISYSYYSYFLDSNLSISLPSVRTIDHHTIAYFIRNTIQEYNYQFLNILHSNLLWRLQSVVFRGLRTVKE